MSGAKVRVALDARKGRCVVATEAIAAGELIEATPAVVLSAADCGVLDRTPLAHYYFEWDSEDGRGAIGLGLATLCNHSARPRARVERNYAATTLDLVAEQPIAAGDEVTIDYNCPLWFDVSE